MRLADLSFTVSQRKLACVLDPALVLGHCQGAELALRLARVLEPWLTRSFWQVIDASELLLPHTLHRPVHGTLPARRMQPDAGALAAWIALRDVTDAGSWTFLRWIGDNRAESQVRDAAEPDIVDRYEQFAAALARRAAPRDEHELWHGIDPVQCAMDTLALSACLGGAVILSQQPEDGAGEPWPVQALMQAGLEAHPLAPMPVETLFAAERQLLRNALAGAGLAAMLECLGRLAVVHVTVDASALPPATNIDSSPADPWADARAWWYLL
jgi:hypothetical protein